MGNSKKAAKFPRYDKVKEKYGAAIDRFLKEYGDEMNYANAQPFLAKAGIDVSKPKYNVRVLHYRRHHKPTKNK